MIKIPEVDLSLGQGFSLLNNGQRVNVILTNQAVHSPLSVMPGLTISVISVATLRMFRKIVKLTKTRKQYLLCVKPACQGFTQSAKIIAMQ